MWFPVSDHNQLRAKFCDFVKFVPQLRDLLAAKESAKMPDEDEYGVLVLPALGKRQPVSVRA